jgi:hypothetical protein
LVFFLLLFINGRRERVLEGILHEGG